MKKLFVLGISCLFSLISFSQKKDSMQVHADTAKKVSTKHVVTGRSIEFSAFGHNASKDDGISRITFFQDRKGLCVIGTFIPWGPSGMEGLSAALGVPIKVAKNLLIITPAFGFSEHSNMSMLFALRTQSKLGLLTLNTLTQIDNGSSVIGNLSIKVLPKLHIGMFGQVLNFIDEKDEFNNDHTFIYEAGPQIDFHLNKFTISAGEMCGKNKIDHNYGYDHLYQTITTNSLTKRGFVKIGLNF